jgi:hypothetical protein
LIRRHSLEAYDRLLESGRIRGIRRDVLVYLHRHGPATRNELDAALAPGRPNPPHSRRIAELAAMDAIHVVGERDGADLWDVTEAESMAPAPKKRSSRELVKAYLELRDLLTGPRATVLPDATIEQARSIIAAQESA